MSWAKAIPLALLALLCAALVALLLAWIAVTDWAFYIVVFASACGVVIATAGVIREVFGSSHDR